MPAGTHTNGRSCAAATAATTACEPSPPAIPITSAPRATASSASARRSSPGASTTGSMPRCAHSPWRSNLSTLPPPDFVFISSTPWRAPVAGLHRRATADRISWRNAHLPAALVSAIVATTITNSLALCPDATNAATPPTTPRAASAPMRPRQRGRVAPIHDKGTPTPSATNATSPSTGLSTTETTNSTANAR